VEDNTLESDSNEGTPSKSLVEANNNNFGISDKEEHIHLESNEVENIEKTEESGNKEVIERDIGEEGKVENIDYDMLLEKLPIPQNLDKSGDSLERDIVKHFPILSDEENDHEIDVLTEEKSAKK